MTFPFINHSATASLPGGGGAHTSLAVSLTADNDNEVVLILVTFSLKSGSTPTVTGITGGGLTFAQHAAPTPLSSLPIVPSGTGTIRSELWWAAAGTAFTGTSFTVTFSSGVTGATGDVLLLGVTVIGCATPTAPFAVSPAMLSGAAPQTLTFNAAGFTDGATTGSVIYVADAMLGSSTDALGLAWCLDTTTPGTVTSGWASSTSVGEIGAGAFPDFGITLYTMHTAVAATVTVGPKVFLRWSDDGGHSYGNPIGISMGDTGEYLTSHQWNRLGMGRRRVFEIFWSGATATALLGAWIDSNPAQS